MQFIWKEEVTSTSDLALHLRTESKIALPYAVAAGRQSQGRGQRGRSWESPAGNLYLTLCFAADGSMELAPLQAATILARWLEVKYRFWVRLKWPNDVFFAGRKLAGILCETSVCGGTFGDILIGIGLNLARGPAGGVSLCEIIGESPPSMQVARELADHFALAWPLRTQQLKEYQTYSIQTGDLWQRVSDRTLWSQEGLTSAGELELKQVANEEKLCVTSAAHDFRWYLSMFSPFVIADLGNSKVKLARYEAERSSPASPTELVSLPWEDFDADLKNFCQGLPIYFGSVYPGGLTKLKNAVANHSPFIEIMKRPVFYRPSNYDFAALGIDRLAIMEAYCAGMTHKERLKDYRLGLLVSCGTAVTIDLIKSNGEHLGGFILPGIFTAIQSLNNRVPSLPKIDPAEIPALINPDQSLQNILGHSTREAIVSGELFSLAQTIRGLGFLVAQEYASALDYWVTGGDGELLASYIPGARYLPHLVVHGLHIMAMGGVCQKPAVD